MTEVLRATVLTGALLTAASMAFAAPSNDDCAGAKEITTLPFRHVVDLTTATAEPGETLGDCAYYAWTSGSDDNSAWYRYTATQATSLDIDTLDSAEAGVYGTLLTAFRGTCGALTEIACHGYDFEYALSRLIVTVAAGETILIRVVGTDNPVATQLVVRASPVLRVAESFPYFIGGQPAGGAGGDFLVVWHESEWSDRFKARHFDAGGAPLGLAVTVNGTPTFAYRAEVVRTGPNGGVGRPRSVASSRSRRTTTAIRRSAWRRAAPSWSRGPTRVPTEAGCGAAPRRVRDGS